MSRHRTDATGRTISGRKQKADCRADTRGGRWAGIPVCLIESPAYRDLSMHARVVLVELAARMNGWNNGSIAVSHRELVEALACSPNRIVKALSDLMEHGLIDVSAEGQWKERQAREYRLTFVSTKNSPATNDYLKWSPKEKSGATGAVAEKGQSATGAVAGTQNAATGAIARLLKHKRKSADLENSPATGAVALICKPYPPGQLDGLRGDNGLSTEPIPTAAPIGPPITNVIDEDDLRKTAAQVIARNGRGSEVTLARRAGIHPSNLDTFLHQRMGLPGPSLLRLNRALAEVPSG